MNGGHTTYHAKIVVRQAGDTTTADYYCNASLAGPTDSLGTWSNDANAFDGSTATAATITAHSAGINDILSGTGTSAPASNTDVISLVEQRVFYTSAGGGFILYRLKDGVTILANITPTDISPANWSSYATVTAPASGWTWNKINGLTCDFGVGNATTSASIYRGELRVTYYLTGVTKLQPEYHLINASFNVPTTLADYDTLWDPAEWSGVTNTYYHEANSVSLFQSDLDLQDTAGPTQVTNSTITDCIQRERSSALTMPVASATIDTKHTGGANAIAASRILVQVVVSASSPTAVPPTDVASSLLSGGVAIADGGGSFSF